MRQNFVKITTNAAVLFILIYSHSALAHVLSDESGWAHPLTGLDHILAMVAVGAWSAIIGGRGVWVIPSFFLIFMFLGGLVGFNQVELHYIEQGISISVIFLGIAVAIEGRVSVFLASICTALFGMFHGYAHGYEIPVIDDVALYIAGFMITTAVLHIVGLFSAHFLLKKAWGEKTLRLLGFLCAACGVYLLITIYQ